MQKDTVGDTSDASVLVTDTRTLRCELQQKLMLNIWILAVFYYKMMHAHQKV